jgi:N-acetylglutamate synthase
LAGHGLLFYVLIMRMKTEIPETGLIRSIEERSLNAWPALQTMFYDGWVLRFAQGHTRRANSVNPLYPSEQDINEKISTCEQLYRGKGLNTIFKLTSHSDPAILDALLADQGYQTDAPTSVQLLDLDNLPTAASPNIDLAGELTDAWLDAYCRMSSIGDESRSTHAQILRCILPEKSFASITVEGRLIACGLGVCQDGWIGVYDIVTDPGFRRRGHGQQLIEGLLAWAKSRGARRGYLQVMLNHLPALALYAKLGYREAYRYWYRVKPQEA